MCPSQATASSPKAPTAARCGPANASSHLQDLWPTCEEASIRPLLLFEPHSLPPPIIILLAEGRFMIYLKSLRDFSTRGVHITQEMLDMFDRCIPEEVGMPIAQGTNRSLRGAKGLVASTVAYGQIIGYSCRSSKPQSERSRSQKARPVLDALRYSARETTKLSSETLKISVRNTFSPGQDRNLPMAWKCNFL
ncbi:hypothetical protein BKA80DRAFT_17595 [Phyllosticta citrichinensis]